MPKHFIEIWIYFVIVCKILLVFLTGYKTQIISVLCMFQFTLKGENSTKMDYSCCLNLPDTTEFGINIFLKTYRQFVFKICFQ